MSTLIKSRKPLIISIAFACTLPLFGCDVEVEEKGRLPDVDIDAGKLPKVDVDGPEVNVRMEEKKVKVPDVDVKMEEKTISVPDVDVDLPEDD